MTNLIMAAAVATNVWAAEELSAPSSWINGASALIIRLSDDSEFSIDGLDNPTVTVTTNVTHWSDEVVQPHSFVWSMDAPPAGTVIRPATEKTETTEITETRVLRFEWDGETHTVRRVKLLSRKVRRWVKRETWEE